MLAGLLGSLSGLSGAGGAPAPIASGSGSYSSGGLSVGSKVVGSGSAATTVPSAAVPTQGGVYASAPSEPLPSWLIPAGIAVGLFLVVLTLFAPRRRGR